MRGGAAGRVAASRRSAWRARASSPGDSRPTRTGKHRGARAPSNAARAFKMIVMVLACAAVGFCAVFLLDTVGSWVGTVRVGETSLQVLWDKAVDRMLDRDVP